MREQNRNFRGRSQDRSYRGHSRDRSNRGQNYEKDRPRETVKRHENWREEQQSHQQKRESKEQEVEQQKELTQKEKGNSGSHVAGILVIPSQAPGQSPPQNQMMGFCQPQDWLEYPSNFPVFRGCIPNSGSFQQQQQQRQLFDPNNPNRPIIVSSPGARAVLPLHSRLK
jgi:hypothetical protein